ncbi:MAG: TonB-dependent receptor [Pseudoalteromonas sp.]|nr:TonB-dependent receptor [Pseudoalteromonas sp.]
MVHFGLEFAHVNDDLSLQFVVNNVLDKTYYANSYSAIWTQPGEPLNYKVSLQYNF